jgi:hypothetical protein
MMFVGGKERRRKKQQPRASHPHTSIIAWI